MDSLNTFTSAAGPKELSDFADLVTNSENRETVMFTVLVILAVGYLLEKVLKFTRSRSEKNGNSVDKEIDEARIQSIRVITTKDIDGNYILLSVPRLMRELIGEIRESNAHLTNLVNHQSSIMTKLGERIEKMEKRHRPM